MRLHPFVEEVAKLQFENCFNPYTDRCEIHDRWDAPRRRASVLSAMLRRAAQEPIDAIWIGRDLGYRGGRRTGLALTDDVHMFAHAKRWGVELGTERPTKGGAIAERTAAVIWSQLDQVNARIFLWNVFPLHPYEPGDCFSNRQHNASERSAGEKLLQLLVAELRPTRIVAIGNDAAAAARRIDNTTPVHCVRHPSYGGQTEFQAQVASLYKLSRRDSLF